MGVKINRSGRRPLGMLCGYVPSKKFCGLPAEWVADWMPDWLAQIDRSIDWLAASETCIIKCHAHVLSPAEGVSFRIKPDAFHLAPSCLAGNGIGSRIGNGGNPPSQLQLQPPTPWHYFMAPVWVFLLRIAFQLDLFHFISFRQCSQCPAAAKEAKENWWQRKKYG